MIPAPPVAQYRPRVAFGPEVPGWGSWDWIGADLSLALSKDFTTRAFRAWEEPDCDIVVLVKHPPRSDWVERVARRAAIIYAPVDAYDSAAAIDADAAWLRKCARIVLHCDRLQKYFASYTSVEYLDHHVKFVAPMRDAFQPRGHLLWVGVRSNLGPLVRWVNTHELPAPLDILTNLEDPERIPTAAGAGFRADAEVQIHHWSPERQVALTTSARGALDIKGDDFRSRHKPPAKAIDFVASGLPLAMNQESSPVEHLARMGFEVASPLDPERWLSRDYWEETRRFGLAIRELLSRQRVARRWKRLIEEVFAVRVGSAVSDEFGNKPHHKRVTTENTDGHGRGE
jgi:hypothetical protein